MTHKPANAPHRLPPSEALELPHSESNSKSSSDKINKIDMMFGLSISKENDPATPGDAVKLTPGSALIISWSDLYYGSKENAEQTRVRSTKDKEEEGEKTSLLGFPASDSVSVLSQHVFSAFLCASSDPEALEGERA
jgi:hypothetical protein